MSYADRYYAMERRILDKKSPEWIEAWNRLRPYRPEGEEHIVSDSNMTVEEINARTLVAIDRAVPYEWSHAICKCFKPNYDGKAQVCFGCGKIARWRLQNCADCREKYVKGDFEHHAVWVIDEEGVRRAQRIAIDDEGHTILTHGMCFNCLNEHYGTVPEDVYPSVEPREVPTLSETSFEPVAFGSFSFE